MKYEIIEHEKLSRADFAAIIQFDAAIIQFDSCNDAMTAAKAINESSYTNSPGIASEGNTGAFRVGKYVVFNACNQACYDKFLKIISSLESPAEPGESSVDSLATALWDGMTDPGREVHVDRDAAIAYFNAMFPEAETSVYGVDRFYFDYCGVKYTMVLDYDRDENNELHDGKIIVYDHKNVPVTINCLTRDVKGTLEKFFKNAGNSPDEPSLMERLDKVDAEIKALNSEIKKIKKSIKK